MSDLIAETTTENFDSDVVNNNTAPVLVDFWAPWCGPCKALAPVLETVAASYAERVQIKKVNVDEHPDVAKKYGVRGIPTLLLFKEGAVSGTKVGAMDEAELKAFIEAHI
jgi:thioredoxin 1